MMENVICDIPSGLAGTTSKSKFEGKFIIDMPAVIGIEDNINSKIMGGVSKSMLTLNEAIIDVKKG